MKSTTNTPNLTVFCSKVRPTITTPFSQGEWTYYTDGMIIIRIPKDPAVPERDDAPANCDKLLFSETDPVYSLPLSKLKYPPLEGPDDCERCEGSGTHTCSCGTDHECGVCNGKGKMPAPDKPVPFGPHQLSHLYLHKIKHLPNPVLHQFGLDPDSPIGITFDGGGQGRLMGMRTK